MTISIHAPLRERPLPLGEEYKTHENISIHAPLRERPLKKGADPNFVKISIHAPLRERRYGMVYTSKTRSFQSTLPYGSDSDIKVTCTGFHDFNPRSLTGATFSQTPQGSPLSEFQSTLPYGSDDMDLIDVAYDIVISIHAPLRERLTGFAQRFSVITFQSTLPYGSDLR